MKKIVVAFFLLLFPLSLQAGIVISPDDSLTMGFWVDLTNTPSQSQLIKVQGESPFSYAFYAVEYDSESKNYFIKIYDSSGSYLYYTVYIPDGLHQLIMLYGTGLPSDYYISGNDRRFALFVDGQFVSPWRVSNNFSVPLYGNVTLSNEVVSGSFFYVDRMLNEDEIKSAFNFGVPGTIKYHVNVLFWEVLKHFRSFF